MTYKKDPILGKLTLDFDRETQQFEYAIVHYAYPNIYEPRLCRIEEGDRLIVRNPSDGSVLIDRIVEFDFDSQKSMNLESGTYHQMVASQPVHGILVNIEPTYWFNLFIHGYMADLYIPEEEPSDE